MLYFGSKNLTDNLPLEPCSKLREKASRQRRGIVRADAVQ